MSEIPDKVKRWTAKRRVALVLELLRGETTAAQKYCQNMPLTAGLRFSEPHCQASLSRKAR